MKLRKDVPVSEMTEKELLRWHMEMVTKESYDDIASDCATAMANLYRSLHNGNATMWLGFVMLLQFSVNGLVLIKKLFRSKR